MISGLFCRIIPALFAEYLNTALLCISAALSYVVFYQVIFGDVIIKEVLLDWIAVGEFQAKWTIIADSLSAVMLIVVTSVSAMVHLYSIGYMHHDPHKQRFMSYLSAFTFFMLMLVTSENLLQLFFGWEGVGLCSYLLIGFWFQKESACRAAIKAFVVNRVGDLAFALGIYAIYVTFDSIEFAKIFGSLMIHKDNVMIIFGTEFKSYDVICILLFLGAMGKSAQFGLHVWLPDAMEGPTPVSALIHAATMVTAGVFLIARFSLLYEYSEIARIIITYVGAFTCLFAATIALTQNDIKRIIAYSTCSQLGYMFFACGVSAYAAGVFHLMTHAAFKALLFLSAGSVIHAVCDEQDIRKMGGIWKKIPFTYAMFWIGSLALAGVWPFAGYFSKDAILEAAFASSTTSGFVAFYLGIIAAFLTAFYSWRLIFIAFHGATKMTPKTYQNVHEGGWSMNLPLCVLALGAVLSGYYGMRFGMIENSQVFWHDAMSLGNNNILEHMHHVPMMIKYLPLLIGIAGIAVAYLFYIPRPRLPVLAAKICAPVYHFLYNKWFIDELYNLLLVRPILYLSSFLWHIIDHKVIDGLLPMGSARFATLCGRVLNIVQTGYIYHYVLMMLCALVTFVTCFVFFY
jgi:NADH-quinone oxidoreductase subunit L